MTIDTIQGIRKAVLIILFVVISWLAAIGLMTVAHWVYEMVGVGG